jgi:RimJ/RimL family protein N-acetyltransferase
VSEPRAAGLPVDRHGYRFDLLARADIEALRGFRNAQMDVLRQAEPITPEAQQQWFATQVEPAHAAHEPAQLLIGINRSGTFIGYGGLTHLDWEARRAEVSFLVDPRRAADADLYRRDSAAFLSFLADWSFGVLDLHRLFAETYAFRDLHISLLEEAGYRREGRLREHVMTPHGLGDSVLHGLLASEWRAW